MSECQKEAGEKEAVTKQRIAKRAAVACASLPDELTIKGLTDKKAAKFLSAMRTFMAECTLAYSWGREDVASYSRTLDLAEGAFELGSFAEASAAGCGAAKRVCVQTCDYEDGSYFCYFDCRLEYAACLASVVLGTAKFSTN
jgi:hypothetical protein